MNKKAIAILGAIFLLIVGTLGFLIYSKYGGKSSATPPVAQNDANSNAGNNSGNNNNGGQDQNPPAGNNGGNQASSTPPLTVPPPTESTAQFAKLIDSQVISPALFYNNKGVTYFNAKGQLYQASFNNNNGLLQAASAQSLDIEERTGITNILWPQSGDDFIAEFGKGDQRSWSFYDSSARLYTDYPSQVEAVDWMPSGSQVLYVWLENGKATLNSATPDLKSWKYISDFWEADDSISISPDGKNILYYERNSSTSTNPINLTTPDGKLWKTLVKDGQNFGVLWSPDSQKFLFGKKDRTGTKFQLWYYDLLTGEVKNLGVATTPDKAAWGKDSLTVYAAVPVSGIAGGSSLTVDTFYKIDTGIGDKKEFKPDSTMSFDGRDLFLNDSSDTLFFKNAQDGALYYLNLSQ